MAKTLVRNHSTGVYTFPAPYSGSLNPGDSAVLDGTPETILANLGGDPKLTHTLAFTTVPASEVATSHNTNPAANLDDSGEGSIVTVGGKLQVGVISDTQHGARGGGTTHASATQSAAGFHAAADKKLHDLNNSAVQTVNTAGAQAADVVHRTTRYLGGAAGDNITSSLANGASVGQRKSLVLATITATKTVVITPATFADGTTITLATAFDAVELEWQAGGWIVVHANGTALVA